MYFERSSVLVVCLPYPPPCLRSPPQRGSGSIRGRRDSPLPAYMHMCVKVSYRCIYNTHWYTYALYTVYIHTTCTTILDTYHTQLFAITAIYTNILDTHTQTYLFDRPGPNENQKAFLNIPIQYNLYTVHAYIHNNV